MRSLIIAENEKLAALMEDGKALDYIVAKHDLSLGDIYSVTVENIMPSIDAVFVNLGNNRMGFLHANDVPGGRNKDLRDRVSPGQKLLVQIVKEPTGKKGPRVNLDLSVPGRYFVLTSENSTVAISRRITDSAERNRLKTVAGLMKPEEIGLVIRTEASGRSDAELEEDFVNIWAKWRNIIDKHENNRGPGLVYKEQDFIYLVLRDYFNSNVDEIIVDSLQAKYKCEQHLQNWTGRAIDIKAAEGDAIFYDTGLEKELKASLSNRADLPSGGYVIIQTTEALTAIDINSGRFTSSTTLRETVRRTNMEAAVEIARQMHLRNIGGMIIVDFIDMPDRSDRITVMETLESAVKVDRAKPQIGQLSDLCLVEITRKRSGQALREVFGVDCTHCEGLGVIFSLKGGHSHAARPSGRRDTRSRDNRSRDNRDNRDREPRRDNRDREPRRDNRDNRSRDNRDNRSRDNRSRDNRDNRPRPEKTGTSRWDKDDKSSSSKSDKTLTQSKTFASTHTHMHDESTEKKKINSTTTERKSHGAKKELTPTSATGAKPEVKKELSSRKTSSSSTSDKEPIAKKPAVRRAAPSKALQKLVNKRAKSQKSENKS